MPTQTNVVMPEQKSEYTDMSSMKSKARILANYIGGRWVPAQATGLLDVTNPSNGEVLARVPLSGVAEIEAAVSAASAALPDWRARSVGERTDFIYALREKFRQRSDELAKSVTRIRPCKSRPIASVNLLAEPTNSCASMISRSAIVCRFTFGTSMPIVDFPGIRSIKIDSACSAKHKSKF